MYTVMLSLVNLFYAFVAVSQCVDVKAIC